MCRVLSDSSVEVQTGTSYIRWGRKTCEGNASLIYAGNISKENAFINLILLGN